LNYTRSRYRLKPNPEPTCKPHRVIYPHAANSIQLSRPDPAASSSLNFLRSDYQQLSGVKRVQEAAL